MKIKFRNKKYFLVMLGYLLAISHSCVLTFTFYTIYFEGLSVNTWSIPISINSFGEAHIEALFIPLSWIIIIYGLGNLRQKKVMG